MAKASYKPGSVPRTLREMERRGRVYAAQHRPWESIRRCGHVENKGDMPCLARIGGGWKKCHKHGGDMATLGLYNPKSPLNRVRRFLRRIIKRRRT